ncbi:hypothetical protein N9L92_03640, partial [Saprospiraceae bacterium]|nr:hypothetical protein [Saprospiraceae bacterium]
MNLIKKGIYTVALLLACFTLSTSQCTLIPNSCNSRGDLGPNILGNGSFEDNTPGLVGAGGFQPNAAGWNFFGAGFNQFIEFPPNEFSPCGPGAGAQPAARTGSQLLKIFGQFNGGFNASGAFSNLFSVTEGETYLGSVYMLSPQEASCPIDHIQDGIFSEAHLEFFDADGVCLFTTTEQFTSGEANGGYMEMRTISVAPPGSVSAQLNILFFQPLFEGGAIYYDDASVRQVLTTGTPSVSGLSCNDAVNISANDDCGLQLNTDALLEGDFDDFFFDFEISNSAGAVIDVEDVAGFIGQTLTFTVSEIC